MRCYALPYANSEKTNIAIDVFYCLYSFNCQCFLIKDARSVSWFLIIVYKFCSLLSILNELTLQKELHRSLERYLSTTETTERVVWSQAI